LSPSKKQNSKYDILQRSLSFLCLAGLSPLQLHSKKPLTDHYFKSNFKASKPLMAASWKTTAVYDSY
jgi:hypothetical protein